MHSFRTRIAALVEAMACGAPMIACRNFTIAKVAGDAVLFVGEDDPDGMAGAIDRLRDLAVREAVTARVAAAVIGTQWTH